MNAFELITVCIAGAVFGVVICVVAGWRQIGVWLALLFGAIGGLLGGSAAHGWFPSVPTWGSMGYHPLDLVFALLGAIVIIFLVRMVWGPDVSRPEQGSRTA
jgi:uncharacterized membrane protein YeaQ/YmgE (transglycosylase-associated protein family)